MLDTKVVKILPKFTQGASFLALKVTKIDKIGVVRGCFYYERTVLGTSNLLLKVFVVLL